MIIDDFFETNDNLFSTIKKDLDEHIQEFRRKIGYYCYRGYYYARNY